MSDFLDHLLGPVLNTVPLFQPRPASRFESTPGVSSSAIAQEPAAAALDEHDSQVEISSPIVTATRHPAGDSSPSSPAGEVSSVDSPRNPSRTGQSVDGVGVAVDGAGVTPVTHRVDPDSKPRQGSDPQDAQPTRVTPQIHDGQSDPTTLGLKEPFGPPSGTIQPVSVDRPPHRAGHGPTLSEPAATGLDATQSRSHDDPLAADQESRTAQSPGDGSPQPDRNASVTAAAVTRIAKLESIVGDQLAGPSVSPIRPVIEAPDVNRDPSPVGSSQDNPPSASEPIVRVTIGRVEVRAASRNTPRTIPRNSPQSAKRPTVPRGPTMSLQTYLARRKEGHR